MSGLVRFFRDFLPIGNSTIPDYNESIVAAPEPAPPAAPAEDKNAREGDDDASSSSSSSSSGKSNIDNNKSISSSGSSSIISDDEDGSYFAGPWTLQEWRKNQADMISNYFHRRIAADEDMCENTDDEYEDYVSDNDDCLSSDDDDESDGEDDELLGTQQQPIEPTIQRKRQRRIPHINQAIHPIRKLDYVSLFTSELDLSVCEVTRVWRLRDTKRGIWDEETRHKCEIIEGRFPRIPFPHRDDDGPVFPIYRSVLSFEILTQQRERMYVFFYKDYAKQLEKWRTEQLAKHKDATTQPKLLVQMKQIPAVCIIPYSIHHKNWVDQHDLIPYCLCIGDESSMKVKATNDGSSYETVRMDSDQMELRFLYASETTDETARELVLSRASLEGTAPLHQHCLLAAQWQIGEPDSSTFSPTRVSDLPRTNSNNNINNTGNDETRASTRIQSRRRLSTSAEPQLQQEPSTGSMGGDYPLPSTTGTIRSRPVELPEVRPPIESMVLEGSAKKRRISSDTAEYIALSELQQALQVQKKYPPIAFNLYAAVIGFTCGRQTKRGDWMMTVSLIDDTLQENPVTLVIFCTHRESLPKLSRMGDVLRMHRVRINEYKGDIQLGGQKKSSYVVIRRTQSNDWTVLPSATGSFDFSNGDEERSQRLWHWTQHYLKQYPTIKKEHACSLREISRDTDDRITDKDLTVMVSAKYPFPPEEKNVASPCGFLRVWDGTGTSVSDPLPIETLMARNTQAQGDPPPEALEKIASMLDKFRKSNQRYSNLQTPKALCGKVANLIVWEESYWELVTQSIPVGSFLRLRNVDIRQWKDNMFRTIMVHDRSWITPIPDECIEIRWLLEAHNKRMRRNEYNPSSGLLPPPVALKPRVVNPGKPRSKTRLGEGLRGFAEYARLMSFVGLVTLGDTYPKFDKDVKAFCKLSSDGSSFVYQFAIGLHDQSGKLDVIVNDTAGETIVGMPASKAVATSSRKRMELFQPEQKWMAKVTRTNVGGVDYFVLVDISEA